MTIAKLKDIGGSKSPLPSYKPTFLYTGLSYIPAMNKWNWKLKTIQFTLVWGK